MPTTQPVTDKPVELGPPEKPEVSTLRLFVTAGVTGVLAGAALTVAAVVWALPALGY